MIKNLVKNLHPCHENLPGIPAASSDMKESRTRPSIVASQKNPGGSAGPANRLANSRGWKGICKCTARSNSVGLPHVAAHRWRHGRTGGSATRHSPFYPLNRCPASIFIISKKELCWVNYGCWFMIISNSNRRTMISFYRHWNVDIVPPWRTLLISFHISLAMLSDAFGCFRMLSDSPSRGISSFLPFVCRPGNG